MDDLWIALRSCLLGLLTCQICSIWYHLAFYFSPYIFAVAMENFFEAIPSAVAISAAHTIARQISGAASKNAMKFYGILVRISAAAAAAASGSSSAGIFLPLLLNQVRISFRLVGFVVNSLKIVVAICTRFPHLDRYLKKMRKENQSSPR